MRIGVTGHSNLTPDTVPLVHDALRGVLAEVEPPLVGVSCLARGADQVFARAVLDVGGEVEVVLPAEDYRERKVKPDNAADFDELIGTASTVTTMPFAESNRDAYLAASEHVLPSWRRWSPYGTGSPRTGVAGPATWWTRPESAACPSRSYGPSGRPEAEIALPCGERPSSSRWLR